MEPPKTIQVNRPATPENFPPPTPPPPPPPSGPNNAADRAKEWRDEAWLHLRRVVRGDFLTERATDAERARLAHSSPPITPPLAQDYAAWRKSVLWVAAVVMAIYAMWDLATYTTIEEQMTSAARAQLKAELKSQGIEAEITREMVEMKRNQQMELLGRDNAETLDGINSILKLSVLVSASLAGVAAFRWSDPKRSRKWSRAAWLVVFLTPFVLTLLPFTSLMDFSHLSGHGEEVVKQVKQGFGAYFALSVFMMIGPKAIALFPGIIRSSMSLKTLLPESGTPGWVICIMGPMYAVFLLVIMSTVNQAHGDIFLIGGVASFIAGAVIYAWRADRLARPHTPEEVTTMVRQIRRQAMLCNVSGCVLLCIFIMRMPGLQPADVVSFMLGVLATVLLLTIVSSDFVLALMEQSYRQQRHFAGSELEASLENRYNALKAVGYTTLRDRKEG
ncbi:MAG: hypothetical protein KF866_02600 [Phycisphaeraceae bacterium]|nr:hypothetical protein [Phycisphaeraceae bacterium]MCW5753414.1 hypothetical protein [Phycisphaeraceae bacterium]